MDHPSYEASLLQAGHPNPDGMGRFLAGMTPRIPHGALALWVEAGLSLDGMGAYGATPAELQRAWWLAGRHAGRLAGKIGAGPDHQQDIQIRRMARICAWLARFETRSRWDGMERGGGRSPYSVLRLLWERDQDGRWSEDRFEAVMRGLWLIRSTGYLDRDHMRHEVPNTRDLIRLGRMKAETVFILTRGWIDSRRLNYEGYREYRSLSRRDQLASLPEALALAILKKGRPFGEDHEVLARIKAGTRHEFPPTSRGGLAEARRLLWWQQEEEIRLLRDLLAKGGEVSELIRSKEEWHAVGGVIVADQAAVNLTTGEVGRTWDRVYSRAEDWFHERHNGVDQVVFHEGWWTPVTGRMEVGPPLLGPCPQWRRTIGTVSLFQYEVAGETRWMWTTVRDGVPYAGAARQGDLSAKEAQAHALATLRCHLNHDI